MVTKLPSTTLRQLVKLSKRKQELMGEIQKIDRAMAQLERKQAASEDSGRPARVTVSRAGKKISRSRYSQTSRRRSA